MSNKIIIGNATLYHGDAYQIAPTLGPFDCLCIDPPYEFDSSGGGIFRAKRKCMDEIGLNRLDKGFDLSIINGEQYTSVVVFCHNDQLHKILPVIAAQYRRHVLCMWQKTNPMPVANKHYQPECEPYIHAWNKGAHPLGELKDKKRIVTTPVIRSEYDHPTVKPQEVMQKIMKNVNGQRVIDTFAGTGSTGIAALQAGKEFVGIERDAKYFNIMCARIYQFYATRPI